MNLEVSSIIEMADTPPTEKGRRSAIVVPLLEHNAKAYQAAIKMMQQYGKAAIVHPTGTGKSYIAFKLIEDHPDAVIVWLSPSEYIFKTQRESLLRQTNPHCPQVRILLPFHAFFHFGNHLDCKKLQPYLVYLIFH